MSHLLIYTLIGVRGLWLRRDRLVLNLLQLLWLRTTCRRSRVGHIGQGRIIQGTNRQRVLHPRDAMFLQYFCPTHLWILLQLITNRLWYHCFSTVFHGGYIEIFVHTVDRVLLRNSKKPAGCRSSSLLPLLKEFKYTRILTSSWSAPRPEAKAFISLAIKEDV
jgi:hypothetical protein